MSLNTCTNSHEMESVIWNFLLLNVLQNPSQYTTSFSMQAWHWESTLLSHGSTSPHPILCFSTSPNLALYFLKCYSAGHQSPKMLLLSPRPSSVFPPLLEKNPQSARPNTSLVSTASLSSSPASVFLADAVSATLASLALLPQTKHVSPSGSWHLLLLSGHYLTVPCSLPHFLQVSAQISPSQRGFSWPSPTTIMKGFF